MLINIQYFYIKPTNRSLLYAPLPAQNSHIVQLNKGRKPISELASITLYI